MEIARIKIWKKGKGNSKNHGAKTEGRARINMQKRSGEGTNKKRRGYALPVAAAFMCFWIMRRIASVCAPSTLANSKP